MEIDFLNVIMLVLVAVVLITFLPHTYFKTVFTLVLLGIVGYFLLITVAEMPPFGDIANPPNNELAARYIEQGIADTGVPNLVTGILNDYRAMDTLGEATVIFLAIAAAIATIKAH